MTKRSKLFWIGLALRLALLPFFATHYFRDLFIPFLDSAVLNPGVNPWSLNEPHFFPYGSVLFTVLYIPRVIAHFIFGGAALGAGPLGLALIKAPLIVFDLVLFKTLRRLAGENERTLMWLYWLNPIVIFISYVYGHLDIAAMTFAFVSLLFLIQKRVALSALMFVFATTCKFHVAALVPFILAYLWNQEFARPAARRIAVWAGLWLVGSAVLFLPLIFADRLLYASTTSPEALRLFALQLPFQGGGILFLGIFVVLAVLGRLCVSTRITEQGLVYGSAAIMGTLVLVTHAYASWYFWIVPFLSLFFAMYVNVPKSLFALLTLMYFAYFAGIARLPSDQYAMYQEMVFTALQLSLAGVLVSMWRIAVRRETTLYGRVQPVFLGVAGDSGAGKNYFSSLCEDVFNRGNTVVIEGDDYHRWERGDAHWAEYTHLNPRANHLATMAAHTERLRAGGSVRHAQYDHGSGIFEGVRELKPSKTVLVQGLHTFYLRGMRDRFGLKIFLDPHESVRLAWKLKRDTGERGHSKEKVLESLSTRAGDSVAHIRPQRQHADWIIEYFPVKELSRDQTLAGATPELGVRYHLWNDAPIDGIVDALRTLPGSEIRFEPVGYAAAGPAGPALTAYSSNESLDRIAFTFVGQPTAAEIARIAEIALPNLRHVTRGREAPAWRGGSDGVTQLLLVALLGGRLAAYEDV